MTDYKDLVNRLRDTESRSKRKLLDEAANAIQRLENTRIIWHEVTTRQMTEEERAYYKELDIDTEEIFDCTMPDDGQEILVATEWGTDKDICSSDDCYGIGLEGRGDWDGVIAWADMPVYTEEGKA